MSSESKGADDGTSAPAEEIFSGECCLSGMRAPDEVPSLVVLPGADGHVYHVSKLCLDKYSRQLYTFGIAAMAKMMNSRVLLSGLSGLGVEVSIFTGQ